MNNRFTTVSMGLTLMLCASTASALEDVRINGFLTAAGTYTDAQDNTYDDGLALNEVRFDGPDTRVGLQVSADVSERVGVTVQMLARGGFENFDIKADWAYVDYQFADSFTARGGKLKIPTFLTSDYIEVGYAYPWIRPPHEVYLLNPITSLSGVDAMFTPSLGSVDFLIQPFYGSTRDTTVVPPQVVDIIAPPGTSKGDTLDFSAKDLGGINLSATFSGVMTVRAGYLQTKATVPTNGIFDQEGKFLSLGATLDWHNIVAYSEYAKRDVDEAPLPTPSLAIALPDQEAWYLTLGYRINKFLPHITYASLDEGSDPFLTVLKQTSITAGLRYEVANGAALKVEAQRVEPKTENGVINHGLFNNRLLEDNANIYSIAFDVIF